MIRIIVFSVIALASLIFFQNLTPTELDETLNSALQEKKQTEESMEAQIKPDHDRGRRPASIEAPVPSQGSLQAPVPESGDESAHQTK